MVVWTEGVVNGQQQAACGYYTRMTCGQLVSPPRQLRACSYMAFRKQIPWINPQENGLK